MQLGRQTIQNTCMWMVGTKRERRTRNGHAFRLGLELLASGKGFAAAAVAEACTEESQSHTASALRSVSRSARQVRKHLERFRA